MTGLLWLAMIAMSLTPTNAWPATTKHGNHAPPASYLEALQTANAFMWAWLTRDADEGLRLMSDHLLTKTHDEAWLRQFAVGLSNPHHQAFEIGRGRGESAKGYAFPVTLYELYTGERVGTGYHAILKVEQKEGKWRVNGLPISPEIR
jgi:hypothetical protein